MGGNGTELSKQDGTMPAASRCRETDRERLSAPHIKQAAYIFNRMKQQNPKNLKTGGPDHPQCGDNSFSTALRTVSTQRQHSICMLQNIPGLFFSFWNSLSYRNS